MSPEERARLAAMPERLDVYRGVNAYNGWTGLSWTLDRERAVWFARRFYTPLSALRSARVRRERVLALFDAREEHEIVVFPRYLYGHRSERVEPYSEEAE